MDQDSICGIHALIDKDDEDTYIAAGRQILALSGQKAIDLTPALGKQLTQVLFHSFLQNSQYVEAALLAWGKTGFNPDPPEVKAIWNLILNNPKALIMGAGSLGKSYSGGILYLLMWCEDPEYTTIKFISSTAGHARSNVWAHVLQMHKESAVPLPGKSAPDSILYKPDAKYASMGIIAIPEGEDGKGRLQGFHPRPRPTMHPKFGMLTRVMAFIDEAETVPGGLWVGVDNLLTAQTEYRNVRITAVTNPADITSSFAMRAEPEEGFESIDEDEHFDWMSKLNWKVLRLDAKYTANVVQKKDVYHGLQTFEGYQNLVALGIDHPTYFTMGRGMYPRTNVQYNVIPPGYFIRSRGYYNFVSTPINIASLDPAFAPEGDDPVLTTGRYGLADRWIHPTEGETRFQTPKNVIQMEQQFQIKKQNTLFMADDIMQLLRGLRVRPENFVMDKTGNGIGLFHTLRIKYGAILGLEWAEAATAMKIMAEVPDIAKDKYKGLVSEMYFAFARWLEYEYLKFLPAMNIQRMQNEMVGRKFKAIGKFYKIETKAEFKSRPPHKSPDAADSAIMLVHLVRVRLGEAPEMVPDFHPKEEQEDWIKSPKKNYTESPLWLPMD